ncbi:MAG: hypothetical protein P4L79_09905 [Legionella sp.]|uniref:hypothetical protein n=1 Tax=Legionella sp. TaxID=459 RepID=UPI00284A2F21|nr:hypothetical protein [Legionella sp.]
MTKLEEDSLFAFIFVIALLICGVIYGLVSSVNRTNDYVKHCKEIHGNVMVVGDTDMCVSPDGRIIIMESK